VLHAIGFGVDLAAEEQLKAVAAAGGGNYYSATSVQELTGALGTASQGPGGGDEGNDAVIVLLVGVLVGGGVYIYWLFATGKTSRAR
jgi:hypothetical protein